MDCPISIPEKVKKCILTQAGAIVYVQHSDLTNDREFGVEYLVLTDKKLIVAGKNEIICRYDLEDILEVFTDELVGSGRISVKTKTGVFHLVYYSNHLVELFTKAARLINDYLKSHPLVFPDNTVDSFCKKCGSPLPERSCNCPRCVPRIKILKRIVSLTFPYRKSLILLLFVTAAGVILQALPPYLTRGIVDDVIGNGNKDRLIYYTGAMIATGILFLLTRLINIRLSSWISSRIVSDLRSRLHGVLQHLKLSFFNRREPGELVGRIMHDTEELQHFLVDGLPFLIINSLTFIIVGAIMISLNWKLTLAVILPLPLLIFGTSWFWKKLHPLFLREGTIIGHLHSILSESIFGLRAVKACSRENHRIGLFNNINEELASTRIKTQLITGSFNETIFWIMSLGVSLVWFFGARMNGAGSSFSLGDLMAFVGYIWLFYGPLQWFSVVLNWMTHAFSGAERIFEVLDTIPENKNNDKCISLNKIRGKIEFRNIHFSYERGKEVIRGLYFNITPGEIIGLVGRSGAGKSTIINLLIRFFEPDSGSILVDGIPVDKMKIEQLRSNIGIVMQEPFLFNGTIAENIAYGMENVSFDRILQAARAAYAHEFIVNKPDGYDTMVGEGGERLSGGEKQRIAIARAILHDPPILILDEATSSVDASTEQHIQNAISNLIKGRTTIAIAHRLSTLRNADRLMVLSEGKIAETGTHDELIELDGIYAEMVRSYNSVNALQSVVWGG
ncbi:MAG TPA: ABC transporter ATP-binding protein [Chitinispirillaceae bacterium]|nr:ABC transporter ATP-binding protein [Chitinispirillaceae bacterium]